jgi:hypothetical protein
MAELFFILLVDAIEMRLLNNIFVIFFNSKIDLIFAKSTHYIQLNHIKFQYVEFNQNCNSFILS